MIIPISYPLSTKSPLYLGTPEITIVQDKSMDSGDSANTTVISMSSHAGTHVDVPRHFCRNGLSVLDVFQRVNTFSRTYCIDLPMKSDSGIMADDIIEKIADKEAAEALLIRTGSWQLRTTNPRSYTVAHPWVHAGVARLLRKKCPHLRLLGIDTISISTQLYPEEGRESHRAFLCDKDPIYLLEDADLSLVHSKDRFILTVIPWMIEDLDGVPVTAFLMNDSP
jgi:kynurenine formamidase